MGYEWLEKHNPEVDWRSGDLGFGKCKHGKTDEADVAEGTDEVEGDLREEGEAGPLVWQEAEEALRIQSRHHHSARLAAEAAAA